MRTVSEKNASILCTKVWESSQNAHHSTMRITTDANRRHQQTQAVEYFMVLQICCLCHGMFCEREFYAKCEMVFL